MSTAYEQGITVSDNTATIWFSSKVNTSWVDVHYSVNNGGQQNFRMAYYVASKRYTQTVNNLSSGEVIKYSFTYNNGTPAYDTPSFSTNISSTTTPAQSSSSILHPPQSSSQRNSSPITSSVFSFPSHDIPSASGNGALTVKVINGTGGAYRDNQIYWGVLGINPATKQWSYLDRLGQLKPVSEGLNNAADHLSKNDVNYANIYCTISEASWVNLPKLDSGRMFLSLGSPCYIKTFDNGFAGPDINNPSDPNLNIYFDFIEFTVNDSGYHGNTTRVDGFAFPLQHRLVNRAGNYDKTVGELEFETRESLFSKYRTEVPDEFKSLADIQAPYRIVAPIHGSFATGGANGDYFAGYSKYNTQEILLCNGRLQESPDIGSAINRHVFENKSDWINVTNYYKAAPANFYAKFWHDHSINGLAYGFPYDDFNDQASYLQVHDPKALIIRVGCPSPSANNVVPIRDVQSTGYAPRGSMATGGRSSKFLETPNLSIAGAGP
ncbi:unnamed protein product [Didymodactylos carnosus]|uniref:Uncharacterized protein n=1 Tax=Didymodactylos carnosus TaxID=1234261 RepID=A0A814D8V9_9BILA|nr:unnamed protein product [Didymodactylos carnosus]CAF0953833.1 unnamed protein product [Didymodactylos carnosus]CAF3642372.1 unnamed protein product [Didymodactylos carnosus]CAF3729104.1 unnamed protein product [Didymodactylos carnosus]